MKYLIISDTHLHSYDDKKYRVLKNVIEQSDRVILNGDFWDGYHTTFETFINSSWNKLFPLLKSRNAIYIYGNHDKDIQSDTRVNLFSVEQKKQHSLNVKNQTLVIEHGNRLCPFFDEKYNYTEPRWETVVSDALQEVAVGIFQEKILNFICGPLNKKIKQQLPTALKSNEIYVCGHTHLAEFNPREQFINLGFNKLGFNQYVIVDGESIIPIKKKY